MTALHWFMYLTLFALTGVNTILLLRMLDESKKLLSVLIHHMEWTGRMIDKIDGAYRMHGDFNERELH